MSRVNPRMIDSKSKMKYFDLLWTSIAQLETRDEVKQFFKDLLSESEALMLARRIEIAKRLLNGESYDKIVSDLNIGMETVSKVQGWLISGFGGYEKAIDGFDRQFKKRFKNSKTANYPEPYSFGWLKKKYPLHFLLFNLIDSSKGSSNKKPKRKVKKQSKRLKN